MRNKQTGKRRSGQILLGLVLLGLLASAGGFWLLGDLERNGSIARLLAQNLSNAEAGITSKVGKARLVVQFSAMPLQIYAEDIILENGMELADWETAPASKTSAENAMELVVPGQHSQPDESNQAAPPKTESLTQIRVPEARFGFSLFGLFSMIRPNQPVMPQFIELSGLNLFLQQQLQPAAAQAASVDTSAAGEADDRWQTGPTMALIAALWNGRSSSGSGSGEDLPLTIRITEAMLRLETSVDQSANVTDTLEMAGISMLLMRHDGQISGKLLIPDIVGGRLVIDLAGRADGMELDLEIDLDDINATTIYPFLGIAIPELSTAGRIDGRLALGRRDGKLAMLSGDLRFANGQIMLPVSEGLPETMLGFRRMGVVFDYDAGADQLNISTLEMTLDDSTGGLLGGGLSLSGIIFQPTAEVPRMQLAFRSSGLPVDKLMQLVPPAAAASAASSDSGNADRLSLQGLAARLAGMIQGGRVTTLDINLDAALQRSRQRLVIDAIDINTDLAGLRYSHGFGPVSSLVGTLSAGLQLSVGSGGEIRAATASVLLADATLLAKQASRPVALKGMELNLQLKGDRLELKRAAMDAGALGQLVLAASASLNPQWQLRDLEIALRAENLDKTLFTALWPEDAKPRSRQWIATRLDGGVLNDLQLSAGFDFSTLSAAKGDLDTSAEAVKITWLEASGKLENTAITYLREMPPIEQAAASFLLEADRLSVTLDKGVVEALQIAGSKLVLSQLGSTPKVRLNAVANGDFAGALRLLDHPRLNLLASRGISPQAAAGRLDMTLGLEWDIRTTAEGRPVAANMAVNAAAVVEDARMHSLPFEMRLDEGRMEILYTRMAETDKAVASSDTIISNKAVASSDTPATTGGLTETNKAVASSDTPADSLTITGRGKISTAARLTDFSQKQSHSTQIQSARIESNSTAEVSALTSNAGQKNTNPVPSVPLLSVFRYQGGKGQADQINLSIAATSAIPALIRQHSTMDIQGAAAASLDLQIPAGSSLSEVAGGGKIQLRLDLDLTPAAISVSRYGLVKLPGEAAQLGALLQFGQGQLRSVEEISIDADFLRAQGRLLFNESGGILGGYFDYLAWPGNDLEDITIEQISSGGLRIMADARIVDLTPLRGGSGKAESMPLVLELAADRVVIDRNLSVSGLLELSRDASGRGSGRIQGSVMLKGRPFMSESILETEFGSMEESLVGSGLIGGAEVRLAVVSLADGGHQLQITSSNGGKVLKTMAVTDAIRRGEMELKINTRPKMEDHFEVEIDIRDFNVVEAPRALRMFSVLSLAGLYSLLDGDGTAFSAGHTRISISPEKQVIHQARATGPSLAVDIVGVVDRKQETMEVSGMLLPVQGITKLLGRVPIIGEIFTGLDNAGLFATQFTIKGPVAAPQTAVNLASIVPGLLRDIFSPDWIERERKRLTTEQ